MAVVHDLAEAIVGDITPSDGVSAKDKHAMEKEAMESFVETLGSSAESLDIMGLWLEYEQAATPTSLLCKDIDKFEMILQAFEYENGNLSNVDGHGPLDSFFATTRGKFRHPAVIKLVADLESRRMAKRLENASMH